MTQTAAMKPGRDRAPVTRRTRRGFVAIVATAIAAPVSSAASLADPEPAPDDRGDATTADAGSDDDAGGPTRSANASPASVVLAGGANGSIAATGEAWTTWRYGRSRSNVAVDEVIHRVRVSGVGRTIDGPLVGFSAGLLAPSLRLGPCPSTAALAAVWARRDRGDAAPDIEWGTSARDAGLSHVSLSITSIRELSHTSERRGGVTVDIAHFQVHGSLDAAMPCARSTAAFRRSCIDETLRGEF